MKPTFLGYSHIWTTPTCLQPFKARGLPGCGQPYAFRSQSSRVGRAAQLPAADYVQKAWSAGRREAFAQGSYPLATRTASVAATLWRWSADNQWSWSTRMPTSRNLALLAPNTSFTKNSLLMRKPGLGDDRPSRLVALGNVGN